jgi:hypothetical protein
VSEHIGNGLIRNQRVNPIADDLMNLAIIDQERFSPLSFFSGIID